MKITDYDVSFFLGLLFGCFFSSSLASSLLPDNQWSSSIQNQQPIPNITELATENVLCAYRVHQFVHLEEQFPHLPECNLGDIQ
jgi:hypothetical protein